MTELELAQENARRALWWAERLPQLPERALVLCMAERLLAELEYFSRAAAWRARSA